MLRTGLQGFHGEAIAAAAPAGGPAGPHRLELRFERFERASA